MKNGEKEGVEVRRARVYAGAGHDVAPSPLVSSRNGGIGHSLMVLGVPCPPADLCRCVDVSALYWELDKT